MKVLIFDDILVHRQAEYLVPGLELVFYEHADDAVAIVAVEQPLVVLMDYSMNTRVTGADAVRMLRKSYSTLRIVGISSDATSNEQMLDAGANDALSKSHLRGYLSLLARTKSP